MNQVEFEQQVRARTFINQSNEDKLRSFSELNEYMAKNQPYESDPKLQQILVDINAQKTGIGDINAQKERLENMKREEARLKHSGAHSKSKPSLNELTSEINQLVRDLAVKEGKLYEPINLLVDYLAVEATRLTKGEDYNMHRSTPPTILRMVKASKDIDTLHHGDPHNQFIAGKMAVLKGEVKTASQEEPEQGEKIRGVFKIRGDGNCYYRSVMTGFFQNAMLGSQQAKKESFEHFASVIREQLLDANGESKYLVVRDPGRKPVPLPEQTKAEQGAQLLELAATFDAMAAGEDHRLDAFQGLWDSLEDVNFDDSLMKASRALLAHETTSRKDEFFNGLTLKDTIEFSGYGTIEHYNKQCVLKMGVSAEGPGIEIAFLPGAIGCRSTTRINDKNDANIPMQETSALLPARQNFWPDRTVNLLLSPGHYDLLETDVMHQERMEMEQREAQSLPAIKVGAASVEEEVAVKLPPKPDGMSEAIYEIWAPLTQNPSESQLEIAKFMIETYLSKAECSAPILGGNSINELIEAAEASHAALDKAIEVNTPPRSSEDSHAKMNQKLGGPVPGVALSLAAKELMSNLIDLKKYMEPGYLDEFPEQKQALLNQLNDTTKAERAIKGEEGQSINELMIGTGLLEENGSSATADGSQAVLSGGALKLWEDLMKFEPADIKDIQPSIERRLAEHSTFAERAIKHEGGTSINELIAHTHVCLQEKLEGLNSANEANENYTASIGL